MNFSTIKRRSYSSAVMAVVYDETIPFDNEIIILCPVAEKPCATGIFDKKERKLQYQWYHNFRSYLVRVTGVEPARINTRS